MARPSDSVDPASSQPRTTLKDVCEAAGVSKATVSRVLNNQPGVGKKVRTRVLATMKRLNYAPQAAARQLSLAKSDSIGIVFQDLTGGWLLNVFRGVMNVASGTRFNVITSLSTTEKDAIDLPHRLLAEGRVDGLLWLDPRVSNEQIVEMKKYPLPLVVLQREIDDPDITTVSLENTQGAFLAVSHLIRLGYRSIMLLTGQEDNEDSRQRLRGAMQALSEHNEKHSDKCTVTALNGHNVGIHASKALETFMASGQPLPDAIFAFNDEMAIAAIFWLRRKGFRVPEDVAIIGFDGVDDGEPVGLSTIETPMYEMGVLAMQKLIEMIEGTATPTNAKHIMLRGKLVIRESCGARMKNL